MIDTTTDQNQNSSLDEPEAVTKKREWLLFLFLTFIFAPALAIALVGGYGFLIWMFQTIAGPPGPPV